MKKSKRKTLAAEARKQGKTRFMFECKHHGMTEHYTADSAPCVICKRENALARYHRKPVKRIKPTIAGFQVI